jgi:hypothetical protein
MSVAAAFTPFQIMCSSEMLQSLAINGLPLHTAGRIEQVWEDVLGSPELYGEPIHVPLRPGALHIPQVPGPREFTVGMVIYGANNADQAGHNSAWRDLARMLWSPMAPLSMTRTLRFTEGDETHVCAAQFVSGLNPEAIVPSTMSRVALRFRNLDGYWYAQGTTIATISGSGAVTVPGDAQTRRMTLTFEGGGAVQTLTNTTNGCILTCALSSAQPIEVDVFAFTAMQGAANVSGFMTHAGDVFWMRLERGVNNFTLTGGGTVTISARAAYL